MDILSGPGLNGVEVKCKVCKARLRLYSGDLRVCVKTNKTEVNFACASCGETNRLPGPWGTGPTLTPAEAFRELQRRMRNGNLE